MHRIDTPNSVPDINGPGKRGWRDGNKAGGINATEFDAEFMNMLQEELAAIAEYDGGVLDKANRGQILAKIRSMLAGDASTVSKGIVQLATAGEAAALTNALKVLTPSSLASAFSGNQLKATNGYQRLPGGLILQWGQFSGALGDGFFTISLPIAFPTSFLNVLATPINNGVVTGSSIISTHVYIDALNSFKLGGSDVGVSVTGAFWWAIGY